MTGNKTRLPLGEFDTIRLNAPYVTDPLAPVSYTHLTLPTKA